MKNALYIHVKLLAMLFVSNFNSFFKNYIYCKLAAWEKINCRFANRNLLRFFIVRTKTKSKNQGHVRAS